MSRIGIAGLQLDLPRGDNLDRFDREIDSVRKRFPWVHLVVIGELGVGEALVETAIGLLKELK